MAWTRAIRATTLAALVPVAGLAPTSTATASPSAAVHFFPASRVWAVGCPLAHQCLVGGRNTRGKPMLVPVRDGLPGAEKALSVRNGNVFALSCPGRMGCVALADESGKSGTSLIYLI